jgi:hypothetical protein
MYLLPRIPRVLNTLHHWPPSPGLFSMLAVVTLSSCGWNSRHRRVRGDKIKLDVVMKRLTFFHCWAAFDQSILPTEIAMPNRDFIRASEIADWCFCRRSWYLSARGVGTSLVQIDKRHAGVGYHQQHARNVNQARGVMNGATRALLVVIVLAAAYWFWANAR